MSKQAVRRKSGIGWISLSFIFIVSLVVAGRTLNPIRSQQASPKLNNLTKAFQVVSLVQEDGGYLLTLKNISGKPINGYAIATNALMKRTFDLTSGESVISPGESTEIRIPLSQLDVPANGSALQAQITVLVATFADHSGEGEPQTLLEIKGRREGIKRQLNRIIPLLESAIAAPDSDETAALDKLKSQISALADETERDASPYVKAGLRNAKEDMLLEIQKIERGHSIRAALTQLNSHTKNRADRL